jgi:ubiquinone/menaquinone biosynthesis C-methylase UbiE
MSKKTRERLVKDDKHDSRAIFLRHQSAYEYCKTYCSGKRVLDLGCGDGYGTALLAQKAKHVVGIDNDEHSIRIARKRYRAKNIRFATADALRIPKFSAFDVVVSLQFIEHMPDEDAYLKQIVSVLKKSGTVILTTPNRKLRLRDGQQPWNEFHTREYEKKDLAVLLRKYFKTVHVHGMTATPHIYNLEKKRLNLRWLIAYIDIYRHIPKEYSDMALSLLKRIAGTAKKGSAHIISADDYFVTKKDVNASIDLIAVCKTRIHQ